mmetsp:Transcript_49959/g.142965  ORF Transcript_49959/g.142965 Transcript_49959/m.142965 type:complete len:193 (-) Transcript_49959:86-664(-)
MAFCMASLLLTLMGMLPAAAFSPEAGLTPTQRGKHSGLGAPTGVAPPEAGATKGVPRGRRGQSFLERGRQRGVNAGCFVVDAGRADAGRLLLVKHKKTGTWALPGGTGEDGESPEQTAERETLEETGYTVSTGALLAQFGTFRLYRCTARAGSTGIQDAREVRLVQWLPRDGLAGLQFRFPKEAARYPEWMA